MCEHKIFPIDLIFESLRENTMLINISNNDMELIVNGKKSVIVQLKIPSNYVTREFISKNKLIKIYLFNKNKGVFGECLCNLSFNNNLNKKQPLQFPYSLGITIKYWRYKEDKEKELYLESIINVHKNMNINLEGTCLQYDDFIKLVTIGEFIFFIIKDLVVYDIPLQLNDFYIARSGEKGDFKPSDCFKSPNNWCYALKKTETTENLIQQCNKHLL